MNRRPTYASAYAVPGNGHKGGNHHPEPSKLRRVSASSACVVPLCQTRPKYLYNSLAEEQLHYATRTFSMISPPIKTKDTAENRPL